MSPVGMPIFALHSAGTTPALWAPAMRLLPDHTWITPHLNHVADDLPPRSGFDDLATELMRLVPDGPVVIAGSGLGARLGVLIAARLGARVRHLYLAMPGPAFEGEAFRQTVAGLRRFMVDGFRYETIPSLLPMMLYRYGPRFGEASIELAQIIREGAGTACTSLARVVTDLGPYLQDVLPRVEARIEVVNGAGSPVIAPDWTDTWHQVPQLRSLEVLPNASHELALDVPERVAADLRRLAATA